MRLIGSLALAAVGAAVLGASPARAVERGQACAAAAMSAQDLRDAGKLRAAKAQLVACSAEECPNPMRSDCRKWLAEVDDALPSIVVRARDARGEDVVGVRATLDDVPFFDRVTGLAVAVDPGSHRLTLTARSGAVEEQRVVIAQGEKGRAVTLTFRVPLTPDGDAMPASAPSPAPPAEVSTSAGPSRWPAIVAGALGVVGMALAVGFEIAGQNELGSLQSSCGRTGSCSPSQSDSVHEKLYVVAPIAFGVGVVGLGTAGALLLWTGRSSSGSPSVGVAWRF